MIPADIGSIDPLFVVLLFPPPAAIGNAIHSSRAPAIHKEIADVCVRLSRFPLRSEQVK